MFAVFKASIDWIPFVLKLPILAIVAALSLMVLVKIVSAILSIIGSVLSFITSWL